MPCDENIFEKHFSGEDEISNQTDIITADFKQFSDI